MVTSKRVRLPQPSPRYRGAPPGPTVAPGPGAASPGLRAGEHLTELHGGDGDFLHAAAERGRRAEGLVLGLEHGEGGPVALVELDPVAGHESRRPMRSTSDAATSDAIEQFALLGGELLLGED